MWDELIDRCLREDLGLAGDVSAEASVPASARANADMIAREVGVIAGLVVAAHVFRRVDPTVEFDSAVRDGDHVAAGTVVATAAGSARSILTAERTALNIVGHASGIATKTAEMVKLVEGTGTAIADTRKTTPGLRMLDKYAVRMGGGANHRFGLYDAVMIKDNHLVAAGGVRPAVEAARARVGHTVKIEVEVTTLGQLAELLDVGADIVLLDNMDVEMLREAVTMVAGRMVTEASGGIDLTTVRAVAETGVDVISSGALTHSAPNFDVALDFRV